MPPAASSVSHAKVMACSIATAISFTNSAPSRAAISLGLWIPQSFLPKRVGQFFDSSDQNDQNHKTNNSFSLGQRPSNAKSAMGTGGGSISQIGEETAKSSKDLSISKGA